MATNREHNPKGVGRSPSLTNKIHGPLFSVADLAALRLKGLPTHPRNVRKLAAEQNWPFQHRARKSGGPLYPLHVLPGPAQADWWARRADELPARPRGGRPAGNDFFARHPATASAIRVILADRRLSARNIRDLIEADGGAVPSLRTIRRFIARYEAENPAVLAATRDPDTYRSVYRVALGRADSGVTAAHEIWELDTTKADVLTKGGRKMVLGVIDRWSRRARFQIVESESGASVRRLLVDTIAAWGVMPDAVCTDNGSGFVNAGVRSALETLGIEHIICPPGSPEKKPFVERLFGTFTRDRAELLDGFAGHNVAEAQQLRARAKKRTGRAVIVPQLEPAQLQAVMDAWLDGEYHTREHSALRMAPIARWMSSPRPARAAPSTDVLMIALSALVGTATVGKRGVRWKSGRYWSPALVQHIGRQVTVRRDEEDLGTLYLFDADGRFIDRALNPERSGLSEQAFALEARRHQDAFMARARDDLRAARRAFTIDKARDALLRRDAERSGKLVCLPLPARDGATPAIRSIATAPEPVQPAAEALDAVIRRLPARHVDEPSVAHKVAEADRVMTDADNGRPVDPDALRRARLYATSSEYRAQKMVDAHFAASRAAGAQT